ncbi:PKD domain-containing protein [Humibacillus xanthopallidus]|uniref:PKD domain-containing protein n=1 Tax=Humibacillus xanthopallidus TaxID=412689 RepID=UPI00163A7911|nr:PKD domain-containing protein [Humibacillus xanthopallidus]
MAVGMALGGAAAGGNSAFGAAASYTYTSTADFNGGTALNLNTANDELKLTPSFTFPFVWVPASARGTIVKINANTGAVVGEYWSAPQNMAHDPSRTTVDQNGNVWAGNRAEASGGQGSVVQIGLKEAGQCVDRNGNGVIDTSVGLGDIRPWANGSSEDTGGGVTTADDECVIHFVRTTGHTIRQVSIDADNHAWVGGPGLVSSIGRYFDRISPTGTIVKTFKLPDSGPYAAYGGLIDEHGVLWSAAGPTGEDFVWRIDLASIPDTTPPAVLTSPANYTLVPSPSAYGMGKDPSGNIWVSDFYSGTVGKISPAGSVLGTFLTATSGNRGVAVTADGDVWVAGSGDGHVARLHNNGSPVTTIDVGDTPTGVSVDANGKVWVSLLGWNQAKRIDPATNSVDATTDLGAGAGPYTYGDMTGNVNVGGPASGTWTKVIDSGTAGQHWSTADWTAVLNGGDVTVTAAASADGATYGADTPVSDGGTLGLTGRYLRLTVTLDRTAAMVDADITPVLEDITVTTNRVPVAVAGDDQNADEGDLVTLNGTASSDPDGDTLGYSWELLPGYTGPAVTLSDATVAQPTFTPTDNGVYTFRLTVDDGNGGSATDDVLVTVDNVAPVIQSFSSPADPVPVGSVVNLSATFSDVGTNDTHTASFALDSTNAAGTVTESGGSGSATGSFTLIPAGVYTASVTITDDDGGLDTETALVPVVVYDPAGGFVTGGGRITSPTGAFTPDASLAGKATFGFVSRYQKGATIPSGNTEFVFHAAGLSFHSSSYDWLVISGAQAQYKGVGEVTGLGATDNGSYKFILTAVDGGRLGGTAPDTFRIKIFRDDTVLYDNGPGTPLEGGSIIVHK